MSGIIRQAGASLEGLLLLFICLGTPLWVRAQGKEIKSDYYSNHIPKKPESSSLGSFGNTSINYYTGLPEISLGMFELAGREFSLPVSLNYDASGIRTDELSGATGIKWNLSAGGFVQRELKGLADERSSNGYIKNARETNYFSVLNPSDWAQWTERNDKDASPDLFTIAIPGRTIRFVLDKDGKAIPVPRQNVKIQYTTSLYEVTPFSKETMIGRIELTTEDGAKYIFGGHDAAIEFRKIENLVVGSVFYYKVSGDCPKSNPFYQNPKPDVYQYYYDCGGTLHTAFYPYTVLDVKTIPRFTSKWHLVSITTAAGEVTSFSYQKLADVSYVTRPRATRIAPVLEPGSYVRVDSKCKDVILCLERYEDHYFYGNAFAIKRFGKTDPGSAPPPDGGFYPSELPPLEPGEHLNIFHYPPNPGSVNFYHTLITESNIKLLTITSASGNTLSFTTSLRPDLPNAVRYDVITLRNMNNLLIKSIRLGYQNVSANEEKDYFWFSEALLMREFKTLKENSPAYYANYVKKHVASDIPNPTLVKFVFEGLKEHNYKRSFLASIEDITDSNKPSILYEFEYSDLHLLRRRTTPLHDAHGFHRSASHETRFGFASGKNAMLTNSESPDLHLNSFKALTAGQLKQIRYPTGGQTIFHFAGKNDPKLVRIEDFDGMGKLVRQREIEYAKSFPSGSPIFKSYQNFRVENTDDWMKYCVTSSAPQNDSYSLTHGVVDGNAEVIVYHGTKAENNGFERYLFSAADNSLYKDVSTTLSSNPAEARADGNPVRNIFPFPQHTEHDHRRGLLLKHQVFSAGSALDKPMKETNNTYSINPLGYKPQGIKGFTGGSFNWTSKEKASFWVGHETEGIKKYRWGIYDVLSEWIVLDRTEEITFSDDRQSHTASITEYAYDPLYLQLVSTTQYAKAQPDRRTIARTKFAGHADYSWSGNDCTTRRDECIENCSSTLAGAKCVFLCEREYEACLSNGGSPDSNAIRQLRVTHQHSTPVEIQKWVVEGAVETLVSAVLYKFAITGNGAVVRPREVWSLGEKLSPSAFVTSKINSDGTLNYDSRFRKVHSYDNYDGVTGRLLSQTSIDGTISVYSWAHNGSLVSEHTLNPGPEQQKETFVHIPLVGLESQLDANGVKRSYGYDSRKRLAHVRDFKNQLLSGYMYHYAQDARTASLNASISVSGSKVVKQSIHFSSASEVRDRGVTTYLWEFGNGAKKETQYPSVSYAYGRAGTYTVKLTKTHPEYGSATARTTIKIVNPLAVAVCVDGPYLIDIPPSSLSPLAGECTTLPMDVNRTILKATVTGGCSVQSYQWELQSSTGAWVKYSDCAATCLPPGGFTSRQLGGYKIRCVVRDSCGNVSTSPVLDLVIL